MTRQITHKAPFSLRNQNSFFGGWPVVKDNESEYAIAITFPVEGWIDSATVVITEKDTQLTAESFGTKDPEKAIDQAIATLSLDIDDSGWEEVGKTDPFIAKLQKRYNYLRPVLFHSPYEAAAGFVIGQRISVKQRQAIQKKMSEEIGEKIKVGDQVFSAFPLPQTLLKLESFPSISENKVRRLHGISQAASEGNLDRANLLQMSIVDALKVLQDLNGIGPFYASGILYRGAGIVDDITNDNLTNYAFQQAYGLKEEPSHEEVLDIVKKWQPYRMWCEVLLHIWLRREVGLPKRP